MLNVMGSFISTELDAFENLHNELEEKDKEIERLKTENKELGRDYSRANNEFLRLHSIIKEVREYIKENDFHSKNQEEQELYDIALLEILDKGSDKE